MSVWRIKRQINYLLLVVLFFLVIGGMTYFIYRTPANCFDGQKNQNELGVDCGGACQRICQVSVLDLKLLWARPLEISPGSYTAVALVENGNLSEGVVNLPYTIKLFDQSGREVAKRTGTTKIFPRERLAILESNIKTEVRNVSRMFIEFPEQIFWQEFPDVKPLLRVSQKNYSNEPTARLVASVVNETNDDLNNIRVIVVLSDATGNAYTASATLIDNLPRLSSREIFFTWPKTFAEPPTFVDFYTQVLGQDF